MPFTETGIPDLLIYEPRVFNDSRGYFFESYSEQVFKQQGLNLPFVQDNQARSTYGVLRGLHYQQEPYAQTKLIRVLEGKIIDVAVDIRKGSPTYGKVFTIELTAENKLQLLVPKGFAHGYSVLSETAEVMYKVDNFYHKASEGGIIYNDPALNIDWGINLADAIVSEKDVVLPTLENCTHNFVYNPNK
ncbi:dTDP-4-dehydrorhamnose 3,5-epimerase [Chitinophaga agri]|uniref:dTDP-4-dehydrorhamnose 3,5-epimerase n=1 Tax=Chitinophaga agri TaxID=2703787 RepID=A0A6B9ZL87_9BACT|nr:dTDP-4-dehydrorhamnose 3,5-epimerase [Chitinophaga agri]QHS62351.1 dTDP-4-dehydrorhamnose 3,5-epimerase [Chitinophaga agri]